MKWVSGSYEIWCEHIKCVRWRWRSTSIRIDRHSLSLHTANQIQMIIMCFCVEKAAGSKTDLLFVCGGESTLDSFSRQQQHVCCLCASTLIMQIIWFSQARDVCVQQMTMFDVSTSQRHSRRAFAVEKRNDYAKTIFTASSVIILFPTFCFLFFWFSVFFARFARRSIARCTSPRILYSF